MNDTYKNRINMFDFSKGTAMLLILSVYTLARYDFFRNSPAYLVWMFIAFPGTAALFLVMGYWYTPKSFKAMFAELKESALKIYCITGIIATLAVPVFCFTDGGVRERLGSVTMGTFLAFLFGFETATDYGPVYFAEIGAMWYVLCYILGILILNILVNIFKKKGKIILAVILLLLAVVGLIFGNFVGAPFCLPQVAVTIQTLYYGYIIRQNKLMNRKWNIKDWILLLLGCVGTLGIFYSVSFVFGSIGAMYNRSSMLFAVPAGIILLRFGQFLQKTKFFLFEGISLVGSKSIILMAIFAIESASFNWGGIMLASFMPQNEVANAFLVLFFRVVIYTGVCLLLPKVNLWIHQLATKKKQEKAEKKEK